MRDKKLPSPEALGRARKVAPKRSPITFRLDDVHEGAFQKLAARARLGRSAFARRIVEHYIQQHAPGVGGKRS